MGTLSYSYGKPYGYQEKPRTCRWCGAKLRYERVKADESDKANPTYRDEPYKGPSVRAVKPGGYQDGHFCSLRCGYQWAAAMLDGWRVTVRCGE